MWMNTEIIALNTSQQTYYTPWFPKGADNALLMMELIANTIPTGAGAVTATVWTKNLEDEGSAPGSAAATFTSLTGATLGFFEAACTGLKQLVRFQVTFRADAVGQGVIYRFLGPTWYDTAV